MNTDDRIVCKHECNFILRAAFCQHPREKDDITGNGQTKCALGLCNNIPESRKSHVEIPNVGHYGIFNGRIYREMVAPTLKQFMRDYNEG